jgi:hypothetical protein
MSTGLFLAVLVIAGHDHIEGSDTALEADFYEVCTYSMCLEARFTRVKQCEAARRLGLFVYFRSPLVGAKFLPQMIGLLE